ncbi:MAG: tRNA (adenosine(37)-N6)-dimethylallyltransferase MiaA [Minisyncoccota bacterium]
MKEKILIILGPTASGKSDLAVEVAKKFNGEIISADSRQVYKGLDAGTGKVTKKEMGGIHHYLLDVADPKKQFTVSEYKNLALEKIKEILSRSKLPIIVGGTGFYIDAVTCYALFPEVPPNKKLREKLSKLSIEQLYEMLRKKDASRAKTIDRNNKVRLVRALEIIDTLGKVPKLEKTKLDYNFIYIGLNPKDLNERIEKRLQKRMPEIIKEVKSLHMKGLTWKRMNELGLEYRYASMYVQGKISKEEMEKNLLTEIRKYSKRQMTWFKRNKEIKWLDSASPSAIQKLLV